MSAPTRPPGGAWASGTVTAPSVPPPVAPPPGPPPAPGDGSRRRRRQLLVFAGIAAAVLAAGLTVILVLTLGPGRDPFRDRADAPTDVRPPLAKACPAPTVAPREAPAPPRAGPPPPGPRTVDRDAGISYPAYGAPWVPWVELWRAGTLEVPYRVGQHFVTETYPGGQYHASILSAAVPAADNDAVTLDLECVGKQVAADVRAEYYPQPNTVEQIRLGPTVLGGRRAYLSTFRLHFTSPGLTATDELAAVAVIDVGRPAAAVLYVSIPGTHRQWDRAVDEVMAGVRPV